MSLTRIYVDDELVATVDTPRGTIQNASYGGFRFSFVSGDGPVRIRRHARRTVEAETTAFSDASMRGDISALWNTARGLFH